MLDKVRHEKQLKALLAQETFELIVSDTNYNGIAEIITNAGVRQVVTNLWQSPPPDELAGDRFLNILIAEGSIDREAMLDDEPQLHLTATEKAIARQTLGASYRPLVFLIPDVGMAIKRWPTVNFIALGKRLQQEYGATIIVPVGSDKGQAEQIARSIGGTARIWSRDSLRNVASVIAEADLVVAADTGLARIAAALNVPTITLFGPSWYRRYGQPLDESPFSCLQPQPFRELESQWQPRHSSACLLRRLTVCSPCYAFTCPYEMQCLDIPAEAVVAAGLQVLEQIKIKT